MPVRVKEYHEVLGCQAELQVYVKHQTLGPQPDVAGVGVGWCVEENVSGVAVDVLWEMEGRGKNK